MRRGSPCPLRFAVGLIRAPLGRAVWSWPRRPRQVRARQALQHGRHGAAIYHYLHAGDDAMVVRLADQLLDVYLAGGTQRDVAQPERNGRTDGWTDGLLG